MSDPANFPPPSTEVPRLELADILLVFHIAGAGAWLGANIIQAVVPRMIAAQGQAASAGWYRVASKLGNRLYIPAALVILVTGVFLVLENDAYGFGARFVTVGFAMIVVGAVLGIVVFEPGSERAAEAIESADPGRIRAAVSRLAAFGALDTLLILVTITAMVTRWS